MQNAYKLKKKLKLNAGGSAHNPKMNSHVRTSSPLLYVKRERAVLKKMILKGH